MTIYTRTGTSFIAALAIAVVTRLRAAAKRRHQRLALNDLLAMDASRLNDLGLDRGDVVEAMRTRPTLDLDARRQANATRSLIGAL